MLWYILRLEEPGIGALATVKTQIWLAAGLALICSLILTGFANFFVHIISAQIISALGRNSSLASVFRWAFFLMEATKQVAASPLSRKPRHRISDIKVQSKLIWRYHWCRNHFHLVRVEEMEKKTWFDLFAIFLSQVCKHIPASHLKSFSRFLSDLALSM